jgi:hypothetical protein
MRREPTAIVLAHKMDKTRRDLYVEGSRDRLFLTYLVGKQLDPLASVIDIGSVDLPDVTEGGQRGRLIHFAQWLSDKDVRIKFFADADWDRVLKRSIPHRVWLTDYKDLEGYLLRLECVEKFLRVGVGTETISAVDIIDIVHKHGRPLGLLRLTSEKNSLKLPFQDTQLSKYLKPIKNDVQLNFDRYLQALLKNAGISLTKLPDIKKLFNEIQVQYSHLPHVQLIHGKDALCIIAVILKKFQLNSDDVTRFLWTSFEASFIEKGSTLAAVNQFLCRDFKF